VSNLSTLLHPPLDTQAVRSGDMERVRQAQLNIAARRAGATPAAASLVTPGATAARLVQGSTPFLPPGSPMLGSASQRGDGGAAPAMSLDAFLAAHTSEDNASFREILDNTNKRRRARATALLGAPPGWREQGLLGDGSERTDGFGTGGQQPDTQVGWRYTPLNLLMYDGATRESLPLSAQERAGMAQGAPRSINHRATRLPRAAGAPGADTPSTSGDTASPSMSHQGSARPGRGPPLGRQAGGAYDILATPSFDPGVDASPFVTWGDIEATPMRIEAEDLPPGGGAGAGGPAFRMNEVRRREQRAHDLATSAAARQRQKSAARGSTPLVTAALAAAQRARGGAGGGGGGGATPLSEAGRRLAGSMGKGRQGPDMDAALRASYRGATPGTHRGAGVSGWGSAAATPSRASSWTPAGTPAPPPPPLSAAQQQLEAEREAEARARAAVVAAIEGER
jgi:protein DGCR14